MSLKGYFLGRRYLKVPLKKGKTSFLSALTAQGQSVKNIPNGGIASVKVPFLVSLDNDEVIIKKNVPFLEHVWFLPGSVRYVGHIKESSKGSILEGYFEPSHQNSLNKLFFYSVVIVFAVASFWSATELNPSLFGYLKLCGLFLLVLLLIPVYGWLNMTVFQGKYVRQIKDFIEKAEQ